MIICFGEALIDFLPYNIITDQNIATQAYLPIVGGSPANVAIGLSRLKVKTGFAGGLSKDFFGEIIIQHFMQNNVSLEFSQKLDANTTLAFVSLDNKSTPRYAFFDENSANQLYDPPKIEQLYQTDILHFGSFALGVEPIGSRLEALMQTCYKSHLISLDPNIRPNLISDEQAYRKRLARCFSIAHIIKISSEDFNWLYPPEEQENMIKTWLLNDTKLIVVTKGEQGARAYTHQHQCTIPVHHAKFVDAIGAGDSFMSGLLAFLFREFDISNQLEIPITFQQLQGLLKFSAACAAITVSRSGANPPYLNEVFY